MSRVDDGRDVTGTGFRKIDIDEYSENGFQDEEIDVVPIGRGPDENEILQLLTQGKNIDALMYVLKCAPLGSKNQQIKEIPSPSVHWVFYGTRDFHFLLFRHNIIDRGVPDNARNLTQKVLLSIKFNQIEDCLAQLDQDQVDVLMKYIYRGFEIPTKDSSAHLLVWHEKVVNIHGIGSIMRVLADSKRA